MPNELIPPNPRCMKCRKFGDLVRCGRSIATVWSTFGSVCPDYSPDYSVELSMNRLGNNIKGKAWYLEQQEVDQLRPAAEKLYRMVATLGAGLITHGWYVCAPIEQEVNTELMVFTLPINVAVDEFYRQVRLEIRDHRKENDERSIECTFFDELDGGTPQFLRYLSDVSINEDVEIIHELLLGFVTKIVADYYRKNRGPLI